jgi:hypothetical protein
MQEITTPTPGHSRAAHRDIEAAWDQYDEEQEEEESQTDVDRKNTVASESMEDIYRDLREEFAMDSESEEPLPASMSESFGEFVAKEQAKDTGEAARVEAARPDPAEMVAEAVRTAEEQANPSSELTDECPFYIINRKLANCKTLTSTERCCIGLLNSLMQKHGYAYVSNEQLAWWLDMKSSNSVRNILAKLTKMRLIQNTGRRNLEIRWVVCPELQNPKRDRS